MNLNLIRRFEVDERAMASWEVHTSVPISARICTIRALHARASTAFARTSYVREIGPFALAVSDCVWHARISELAIRAFTQPHDYVLASLVVMNAFEHYENDESPSAVVFRALAGTYEGSRSSAVSGEHKERPVTTTSRNAPPNDNGADDGADEDDSALARCNRCRGRAVFTQKQTRSADEGCTVFWRCTKCGHQWVRS